jgi:hypothetical protein
MSAPVGGALFNPYFRVIMKQHSRISTLIFISALAHSQLAHAAEPDAAAPPQGPAAAPLVGSDPVAAPGATASPVAPTAAAVPATETPVATTTNTDTVKAPIAAAPEENAAGTDAVPDWVKHLTIGGGATLWHYHSFDTDKTNFSVFNARIVLDGKWGAFGLHLEPRFRDTKLRPFFDGPAWLQEAYASASFAPVVVKVGKVYKQSGGLFWDNSFYGNVQVYDGLKLDPNYGISVEGGFGKDVGVDFAAQYFVVDGSTNVSLQGRDTISVVDASGARARRKNTLAARVSPFVKLAQASELRLGLSGERFEAGLRDRDHAVARLAADLKLTYSFGDSGNLGLWAEYLYQQGRHVVDHPLTAGASKNTHYLLFGGEYTFWKLTARYNVSHANYRTVNVKEIMHVPALGYAIDPHLSILAEYVVWRQHTSDADIEYDTSSNITLNGQF